LNALFCLALLTIGCMATVSQELGVSAVSGVYLVLHCTFERVLWLPFGPGGPSDNALLSDLGSRHDFIRSTPQHKAINKKKSRKNNGHVALRCALGPRRVSMLNTNTARFQVTWW
jgi:hypothetical protein